jgi:tRNA modification GTPase
MICHDDTIYALSSGHLPAAIAVVRVSGPHAGAALRRLTGKTIPPRQAALANVSDPVSGEAIDQALVLWFPGPASETGEDTAEFQLHGGRAVVAAAMAALAKIDGLRPAEAGEFTRRALENGRLELTAVEGLADLIGAETESQRRQALNQLRGGLGKNAERWRRMIVQALARVEAGLDFSDEGDVPTDASAPAMQIAAELREEIAAALADSGRGERLREGFTIAIAGPPNAGKSSIFNWMAGRDAAIVSPYPGTTRDVLELHLDLGGYPITMLDTAGVRQSDDSVEQEGIKRAIARAADADLILWVSDLAAGDETKGPARQPGSALWRVLNKSDLIDSAPQRAGRVIKDEDGVTFFVSAVTGTGLTSMLEAVQKHVAERFGSGEPALVTRARHRVALEQAMAALSRVERSTVVGDEALAEELRLAARALERLMGRVDVDDVLDVIFRDFCIGK